MELQLDKYGLDESPTAECLAKFLAKVTELKSEMRTGQAQQLVITTRHDLMIERALLTHGLSFQRIVHYRLAEVASSHSFKKVKLADDGKTVKFRSPAKEKLEVAVDDRIRLNEAISETRDLPLIDTRSGDENALEELELDKDVAVVLYKFAGSFDHPESCLLSSEQQVEFARKLLKRCFVPRAITAKFQRAGPVIFMGYSILDADLRLLRKTVYDESKRSTNFSSLLVRPQPGLEGRPVYCQAEKRLWNSFANQSVAKLKLVDCEEEDFIDELTILAEAELRR